MVYHIAGVLLGLVSLAVAKQCINVTVSVQIMARQGTFAVPDLATNEDVTAWTQNFTSIAGGTNYTQQALTGYHNVEGMYDISAKFCRPDHMGSKPVVQVLSHGIGFDKTYWDPPFNNFNYSYIDVAVDEYGYCTLSYDRFGIGNSSHADPYSIVQAPAEVSALYQLNSMLRNGTFPGVDHAFNQSKSIVNVGHSFGSQQTYMLSMMYPNITDAIILTGFSFNGSSLDATIASFNSKLARQNQPFRFGNTKAPLAIRALTNATASTNITLTEVYQLFSAFNLSMAETTGIIKSTEIWDFIAGSTTKPYPVPQNLPNGYCTWSDAGSNQFNFLYPAAFDPEILSFAEATKQPFTVGEILTLGGKPAVSPFAGPVQIITGQQDAIYCSGDCLATGLSNVSSIPVVAAEYFPNASPFSAYIQPKTGHAINLHYNSTGAYAEIMGFLRTHGVVPGDFTSP